MKYVFILIAASYLPLQGPTHAGPPLATSLNAGPTFASVMKDTKKECEEWKKHFTAPMKSYGLKIYYSECLPSPAENMCNNISQELFGHNDQYDGHDCLVQITNYPGAANFISGGYPKQSSLMMPALGLVHPDQPDDFASIRKICRADVFHPRALQ